MSDSKGTDGVEELRGHTVNEKGASFEAPALGLAPSQSITEFLGTLKIHNKDLDACFNDAVAVAHLESLIHKTLDTELERLEGSLPKTKSHMTYTRRAGVEQRVVTPGVTGYNAALKEVKDSIHKRREELASPTEEETV